MLLFINEPEWRVSRFVQTSGLEIPYILKIDKGEIRTAEPMQHILFVDAGTKELIYSESVPNYTTPFEVKVDLLTKVKQARVDAYKLVNEYLEEN